MIAHALRAAAVQSEWERCTPWIEAALEHARGTHSLQDVKDQIDRGEALLWPGERSAAVTEYIVHPTGVRQMHMWLCGGDLDEIVDRMLPTAEAYGVLNGCTRFSTAGRKGWSRVLAKHGYSFYLEACLKDLCVTGETVQ